MRRDSGGHEWLALTALALLLSGCAGVNFYSDPDLKKPTGIPIYGARPYLLVSRTGAEAKPVETSIIYITDPEKVIYADPKSGFGTAKLTLALAGGQLTAFGQETDTKIPELLTQVAGLITARAGAAKTAAEAAALAASASSTQQSALSDAEAAQQVLDIAGAMEKGLQAGEYKDLIPSELESMRTAVKQLKDAATTLKDPQNKPQAPAQYEVIKAQAAALKKLTPTGSSSPRDAALQKIQAFAKTLGQIFEAAQPKPPAPPTFELYEIIQQPGKPATLRPVVVP